jgi:hypothetical protein
MGGSNSAARGAGGGDSTSGSGGASSTSGGGSGGAGGGNNGGSGNGGNSSGGGAGSGGAGNAGGSPDASQSMVGAPRDAAPSSPSDAAPAPKGTPIFVAVGYAGRRVRSRDLGMTWENDQNLGGGGDDEFLLRAVTWGHGVFVATGWKIVTSPDGATWTEQKNPNRQWLGGVQYGNDRFVAAGGYGYSAYSTDGLTWMAGMGRGTEAARSLAFGNGTFVAATDPGNWWQTADGRTWMRTEAGHSSRVVFCTDAFKDAAMCTQPLARNQGRTAAAMGVFVSVRGATIERSTDGTTWRTVRTGGPSFEAITVGYAP